MKVLIVGGVAGGASAAARLRRLSEDAEIIMFERGAEISYANCGIPYHIGNVIKDRGQLVLVSKEKFEKMFNMEVRVLSEVVSINRDKKTITVKDLTNNNSYEESYDKLVLSPGGQPIRPPISGINDSRIFTLRNLEDMDHIKKYIADKRPQRAVVVGAGFIGLEMAENLAHLGMMVSIVELADQVMNLLDFEMACAIHQQLRVQKIELHLKDAVTKFKKSAAGLELRLKSGRALPADLVLLNVGIRPETKLAKEARLTVGKLGGIAVNETMQTTDPDIYALGDAIEIKESVFGSLALIPLANSANKQGRIVADNICGIKRIYSGTPATAIAKVFDLTVAITGSSEKQLQKKGTSYSKTYLNPSSHAGYYPDAFPMILKLLFDAKDGRVLGAQIIGNEGIDKRIDILAAMVQQYETVYTLAKLELAYAPPYSSAKDPINLAGMIALNQIEGRNPVVFWNELEGFVRDGAMLVDVRTSLEFSLNKIDGSINIPLAETRNRLSELPKDKKIILVCNQGKISYFALAILRNLGYENIYSLAGGYKLYRLTIQQQENIGIFDDVFIDKRDDLQTISQEIGELSVLDACGLQCPGPILKLAQDFQQRKIGDVIEVVATDPGFNNDISAWCESTGNRLLSLETKEGGKVFARIQKESKPIQQFGSVPNDKTIVVFSNDLDKAIAAFIIANGAVSMGRKVTMFFTFWGLNVLRKARHVKVRKNLIDKMFGMMMPKGSKKLKLSQMNMLGMGAKMIRFVMKSKKVDSLEGLIESARVQGVKLIACQMSMDVMGISQEEMLAGVEIAGVANYLAAAEKSDTNLFI